MSRKKNILFVVFAVLLSLFLSARQAEARETAASDHEMHRDGAAVDDCFGVPPRELAACRLASQQLAELRRIGLDDCFDVGLGELTACRRAQRQAAQLVWPPLDDCFDVGLGELAACRRPQRRVAQLDQPPLDECFDVSIGERAACRQSVEALSR